MLLGKAVHAEVVFVQNDGLHKKLSELHKNPTEFLAYCAKPHEPEGDFSAASQHVMKTMTVPDLVALGKMQGLSA